MSKVIDVVVISRWAHIFKTFKLQFGNSVNKFSITQKLQLIIYSHYKSGDLQYYFDIQFTSHKPHIIVVGRWQNKCPWLTFTVLIIYIPHLLSPNDVAQHVLWPSKPFDIFNYALEVMGLLTSLLDPRPPVFACGDIFWIISFFLFASFFYLGNGQFAKHMAQYPGA